ncbi:hypothetical protein CHGG_05502 [Chaetomium globosum CBS 148.51]|uniref:HTH CENPB-type domain-containing protein n=1 Tax=Chaetomium globosum (strain ATCC 6205 / CBS 148.51 / DSM 1962 / NBRC 6347 / NRRL 1970) TaxID=306901 RepID=Q2H763_CHAGB|nr:uncharacterized protein CHGG_05502 [Chaetomium globosum CBS 148.51]EAQ88883.1 hypothetical protein CHGG_05502 [Chaetomium globosum CBS 148.51]
MKSILEGDLNSITLIQIVPSMASEDNIQQAIQAVRDGQSIRKASEAWGVSFSTLRDRVVANAQPKGQYEAQVMQKLSPDQEKHLADWVLAQEALGLPVKHRQIEVFANRILRASGSDQTIGEHWLQKFIGRYPVLKTKKDRRMDIKRLDAASTDVIKAWFHLAIPVIQTIDPQDRWNMDETGIMEGLGINGLCVALSETKEALSKHPESRIWTTIIECISATRKALPPLVIFKGKDIQQQWLPDNDQDLDPLRNWRFSTSQNGWTSYDNALEWLTKMFCPTTATSKKRLLIVDGHGSHETDDFMWTCFSNNIYLLFLPGHASHVLQPLDLSVFSPLKTTYRRGINDLTVMTDCAPIGKRLFLRCYAQARKDAITERNIRSGRKASELWPVNLDKPLMTRLLLNPASQPASDRRLIKTPNRSQEVHRLISTNVRLRRLQTIDRPSG